MSNRLCTKVHTYLACMIDVRGNESFMFCFPSYSDALRYILDIMRKFNPPAKAFESFHTMKNWAEPNKIYIRISYDLIELKNYEQIQVVCHIDDFLL